jgi:hypothetical protein
MGFHLKYGRKYVKKTRNRYKEGKAGLLGPIESAKEYDSIGDCKKAITMYKYLYTDMNTDKLKIKKVTVPDKEDPSDDSEE